MKTGYGAYLATYAVGTGGKAGRA